MALFGQAQDQEGQGDLVDPVAEHADQLAGPQRREGSVEGQANVGMAADSLADGDPRPARDRRARRRRAPVPAMAAEGTGASATRPDPAATGPAATGPADVDDLAARRRGAGPGARVALGPARPVPCRRATSGRSSAAVSARPGASPVPGRSRWSPIAAASTPRGKPAAACNASQRLAVVGGRGLVVRLVSDNGREQEERQPRGQEHVADRGHVLDERNRDREDVAERARRGGRSPRPGSAGSATWKGEDSRQDEVGRPRGSRTQIGM